MLKLNKDVLFLVLKELQYDKKSLYSCLLVNKTLCKIVVPVLWKNPFNYTFKGKEESHFNVIVSHLSNEAKENLRSQGINISATQRRPLFNYVSFCKFLKLHKLEMIIINSTKDIIKESKISIIRNEILKLFINGNTKFTHLYLPLIKEDYQIHLIPGAEHCFIELKFLETFDNENTLEGLAKISKSIKTLIVDVMEPKDKDNYGVIKLIDAQKNLNNVQFVYYYHQRNKSFHKALEESLIKHVNTIKYLRIDWNPITNILSHLVNLLSLELDIFYDTNYSNLENVSLPFLEILKTRGVPSNILASLIENTKGSLTEINNHYGRDDNKKVIQAIYQNCSNLKYLKLLINNSSISDLEKVLINCKYLDGLILFNSDNNDELWNNLFKILITSSPASLFKFKIYPISKLELKSSESFFNNWKGRHPILLQTSRTDRLTKDYYDLIEKCKAEGIIERYNDAPLGAFEYFEWIQEIISNN